MVIKINMILSYKVNISLPVTKFITKIKNGKKPRSLQSGKNMNFVF